MYFGFEPAILGAKSYPKTIGAIYSSLNANEADEAKGKLIYENSYTQLECNSTGDRIVFRPWPIRLYRLYRLWSVDSFQALSLASRIHLCPTSRQQIYS